MVLVEAAPLRSGSGSIRSRLSALIPARSRYRYHGYSNRLRDPIEYRNLVRDALLGHCDIQPIGSEIMPGVWAGANPRIDPSARIEAPAYIGQGTCIGASCRITRESAVERECEVDAGTTVEDSCILAGTYVGMGLSVAHSVIAGSRLFHLHRNVELQLADGRLIGEATRRGFVPHGLLRTASALLRREDKSSTAAVSTRAASAASLVTSSRWLGRFSNQG
jgi:carbonic anhydrase/acetyltransferase-like protein (isoleucine patch superfamily)